MLEMKVKKVKKVRKVMQRIPALPKNLSVMLISIISLRQLMRDARRHALHASTLALIAALLAFNLPTIKAAGNNLDYTFSTDGKLTTSYIGNVDDEAHAVAIQPDGKIVVAGKTAVGSGALPANFAVLRYNTNGTIDTSFGANGKLNTDFGGSDVADAVAIQADGKIVVAGTTDEGGNNDFAVARYTTTGLLDTTFSGDGKVIINFGENDSAHAVAIQANDRIIVAGSAEIVGNPGSVFALVQLTQNGLLDHTFGGNGKVTTAFGSNTTYASAYGVIAQPDAKITACGISGGGDFALARYNANGSLDTTFDGDGKVTTDFNHTQDQARAIKQMPDNRYVVVGSTRDSQANTLTALARYIGNGSLDTSFDGDGKVVTDAMPRYSDSASALAVNSSGEIVVACDTSEYISSVNNNFTLLRYTSNGKLDDRFGTGGRVITIFGNGRGVAKGVALQLNGKIVAVGTYTASGGDRDFAVARYNAKGIAVSADFDGAGQADFAVFRPADSTWYIQNSATGAFSFIAWGATGDIPVPGDYDGDGITDTAVFRPTDSTWYILQSSNQAVVSTQFGVSTDKPVQGDYDGDGKTDTAVFRPSNGTWYIQRSTLGLTSVVFGVSTDKPAQGDYDGDGLTDVAVFSPSTGTWNLQRSILGTTSVQFGASGDVPVPADYDGDGLSDVAIFRPADSTWYIVNSTDNSVTTTQWGNGTDIPAPADFDSDGKTDLTTFRPSSGSWYVLQSGNGSALSVMFGQSGDVPVSSAYTPQ